MSFGYDIASVDGNRPPHWPDVLSSGASFIWYRASFAYWDASHAAWACVGDPACHRDWATIPSALVRGAYLFPVLEASQSPEEQVGVFKTSTDAIGGLRPGIDMAPALDIEFPGGIAKTGLDIPGVLAWLRRAIAEMERVFGCRPILYTSGRVWNGTDADCLGNPAAPDLIDCPLWLARYPYKTRIPAVLPLPGNLLSPPVPTPWSGAWALHQFQGDALGVPGFTSTVDISRFHTLSPGDHDPLVFWYKRKLGLPASDKYDAAMLVSVKNLQASKSLTVDGILGVRSFCAVAWLP